MTEKKQKVKVVVLCVHGPFQHYLLNRLAQEHKLLGVVYVKSARQEQTFWQRCKHLANYLNPVKTIRYLWAKCVLPKYEREAEQRLRNLYPEYEQWKEEPAKINAITVTNINDPRALAFVESLAPDIVCVNGTNLIREPLLSKGRQLKYGMLNLHTGLSPYSRGGNCNLFMLLEGKPELVGGTIHYIDKGIDSGDIVRTYQPNMNLDDPYEFIEGKVFIDGINKLSDAVSMIANGTAVRVKQWEQGKLFLNRTGYRYQPYHRARVNRKIEAGLLTTYLRNKQSVNANVRLID